MKIIVNDKGIGIDGVSVNKLNKDTIKVIIDTKIKYPDVYHGSAHRGRDCIELRVTLITPNEDDDKSGSVTFIPETKWEKAFINNCDYFVGSIRYGPEIIYVRREKECNSLGWWNSEDIT